MHEWPGDSSKGQITFPAWLWEWTLLLTVKTFDDFRLNRAEYSFPPLPSAFGMFAEEIYKTRGPKATS